MCVCLRSFILLLIFAFTFCLSGFCDYADLVGKWVRINDPLGRRVIGVAVDEDTATEFNYIVRHGGRTHFDQMLERANILRVNNHASVVLLDLDLDRGRAKVRLLSGIYKGLSGWIPIEWLDNNQKRPSFAGKLKNPLYLPSE